MERLSAVMGNTLMSCCLTVSINKRTWLAKVVVFGSLKPHVSIWSEAKEARPYFTQRWGTCGDWNGTPQLRPLGATATILGRERFCAWLHAPKESHLRSGFCGRAVKLQATLRGEPGGHVWSNVGHTLCTRQEKAQRGWRGGLGKSGGGAA